MQPRLQAGGLGEHRLRRGRRRSRARSVTTTRTSWASASLVRRVGDRGGRAAPSARGPGARTSDVTRALPRHEERRSHGRAVLAIAALRAVTTVARARHPDRPNPRPPGRTGVRRPPHWSTWQHRPHLAEQHHPGRPGATRGSRTGPRAARAPAVASRPPPSAGPVALRGDAGCVGPGAANGYLAASTRRKSPLITLAPTPPATTTVLPGSPAAATVHTGVPGLAPVADPRAGSRRRRPCRRRTRRTLGHPGVGHPGVRQRRAPSSPSADRPPRRPHPAPTARGPRVARRSVAGVRRERPSPPPVPSGARRSPRADLRGGRGARRAGRTCRLGRAHRDWQSRTGGGDRRDGARRRSRPRDDAPRALPPARRRRVRGARGAGLRARPGRDRRRRVPGPRGHGLRRHARARAPTRTTERAWLVVVLRPGVVPDVVVEVPHPNADLDTEARRARPAATVVPGALYLLQAGRAPRRRRTAGGDATRGDFPADVSARADTPFSRVASVLTARGLPQIQLHGFADRERRRRRALARGAAAGGPLLDAVAARLAGGGGAGGHGRGPALGRPAGAPQRRRASTRRSAATAFVHLELSRSLRARPGPARGRGRRRSPARSTTST